MKKLRYKVLFVASWFPNRVNPLLGVFVKRKAEAIRTACDVAVLHVSADPSLQKPYEIVTTNENGIPTVLVYFKPSSTPILQGIVYNIRYFRSYFMGWSAMKALWGQPDIFHVNVVDRAGYFALLMKWLRGFPYVITEHSTPDIDFLRGVTSKTAIPLRVIKDLVIKNSSGLNVDSHSSLEYLQKAGFKGNFRVIPNVVEINESIASQPKGKSPKKTAIHISNLIERKNVTSIIRVCSKIWTDGQKDFELHIVGDGPNKKKLTELANELGVLNTSVFFRGAISEIEKQKLLASASFHILNSDEEGFSVVTAEAISYGTPVIATKCGGPEDFVPPEVGLLIERRNDAELEKAILHMLNSSEQYDPKILREYGRTHFGEEYVAQLTYDMYQQSITHWKAGNTNYPISILPQWKMLDVGSGHQPNRRANVLLERYLTPTIHRTIQDVPIPQDKYMVVGDGLSMPFPDKVFDFVVASHIAEHVDDPVQFCNELKRVSKRGYIETPGPLTEWLMPTASHKWIITRNGNVVTFKPNPYKTSAFIPFFRFFYLNREGYVKNTLRSNNPITKTVNLLLLKIWNYLPYAYMKLDWKDDFQSRLENDSNS
jgi:glycosyltransferase involved in cell wall biosynthesis